MVLRISSIHSGLLWFSTLLRISTAEIGIEEALRSISVLVEMTPPGRLRIDTNATESAEDVPCATRNVRGCAQFFTATST